MSKLLTHCGSRRCSIEELLEIPTPRKTKSYTPLSHFDFASNIRTVATDLLKHFKFAGDQYALSNQGKRMFGILTFNKEAEDEYRLCIGCRNSHDRSMSCGIVIGLSILVCSNTAFQGDISVLRKHTGDQMHDDLYGQIVTAIYRSQHQFSALSEDMTEMKSVPLSRKDKFKYLGLLTGEGILSPTQSSQAYREVWNPSHKEFSDDNLYSAYNAANSALKSSAPQDIIKRHTQLHELTKQLYLN